MIALIDGDIVSYRTAASCEPTRIKAEREPLEAALLRADELMKRILAETASEGYKLFIGGEVNYRYAIYPEYKANRVGKPRPEYLQDVRAFLVTEWKAEITDGIEADDALGIQQTGSYDWMLGVDPAGELHEQTIICSIDKDLLQVPGWHYNFVTGLRQYVNPLDGLKRFYQQLIQGDQSDNIPGYDGKMRPKVPKFLEGDIEALWACHDEKEMASLVLNMYSGDVERMTLSAQLLWIQRKAGEPLWTFPGTPQHVWVHQYNS